AWVRAELGAGLVSLRVRESSGSTVGSWVASSAVSLSLSWTALDLDFVTGMSNSTLDMQVLNSPSVLGTAFRMDDVSIRLVSAAAAAMAADGAMTGSAFGVTPNPVGADGALIQFTTSRPGPVRIAVFDLAGREVRRVLDDGAAASGAHTV